MTDVMSHGRLKNGGTFPDVGIALGVHQFWTYVREPREDLARLGIAIMLLDGRLRSQRGRTTEPVAAG